MPQFLPFLVGSVNRLIEGIVPFFYSLIKVAINNRLKISKSVLDAKKFYGILCRGIGKVC